MRLISTHDRRVITNRERYHTVDHGLISIISRHPRLINRHAWRNLIFTIDDQRGQFPDEWTRRSLRKKTRSRLNCRVINVDPWIFWSGNHKWHASVYHAYRCAAYFDLALMRNVNWPGSLVCFAQYSLLVFQSFK